MTREQLVKHWDVIQAFKDGKTIQYYDNVDKHWYIAYEPSFRTDIEFRIKPEPTKRLPTIEEVEKWFMENKVFKMKSKICYQRIISIDKEHEDCILIGRCVSYSIEDFCKTYNYDDGSELYITENE